MTVLVVHASTRGGTQGVAEIISEALRDVGCEARVEDAASASEVGGARAVIVAGSLYSGRWHREARRFVRRHRKELAALPVWLVASGPLDDSADAGSTPPVAHVVKAAESIGARGKVTFGGRLLPEAKGFPASAMAKTRSGDWRNPERIRAWAAHVGAELAG